MDLSQMTTDQLLALRQQVASATAVNQNESGGAPDTATGIVNPASGARGNMQVLPSTAAQPGFGVKPSNGTPTSDAQTGRDYLQALTQRYGDGETAAIAYNWGPGNTDKWIANGRQLSQLPTETLKYLKSYKANVTKLGQPPTTGAAPTQPTTPLEQQVAANPPASTPIEPAGPPMPMGEQFVRQLGLTARAAGHGLADALGVVANPVNATVNAIGQFIGHNPHLQDVDTLIKNLVDQYTPAPSGALQQGVGAVAEQVANPLNAMIPAGGGLARGALGGALAAGMQPVHGDTNPTDILANMAGGAVAGGALGGLARGISGATLSPEAQQLMQEGVTLTPGQALGGVANSIEQKLSSVPLAGEAVAAARKGAIEGVNTALYNQVLAPIGEQVPKGLGTGRDAVAAVGQKISDEYERVLPQVTFRIDRPLAQELQPILQQVSTMPPDIQNAYHGILDRNFASQLGGGSMPGTVFKEADSVLGKEAANFGGSSDAFQRELGQLLSKTQNAMRTSLERTNPNAPSLGPINQAWRNYTVLRNAAARVNNPDNPIMPGQLQAAVKAGDKSVGKGAFARGTANMQGLSDAAMKTLGSTVPDSGTAGRGLLAGAVLALPHMAAHPVATLGGIGATAAYGTDIGRKAMLAAIAKRPDLVRAFGNNTSLLAPQIGAGTALGVRRIAEGDR